MLEPFWHRFSDFYWNGENHEFITQGIVLEGFYIQKPISFHVFVHAFFMFFSEPLLESIFGAQSADLSSRSRFLVHFRISKGPKMDPRGDYFHKKINFSLHCRVSGSVLEPTLLFLKPL